MLSASRTALPHYCRTILELPLHCLCWDHLGKWQEKQPGCLRWEAAKHSLSSPPSFRGEGPAAQGLHISVMYLHLLDSFYAGCCILRKHKHTQTHFTNSRNKRDNFVPSLTPESKDTDHQQLKTLRSLLSLDVQAAKPQSPHTGHSQPMNTS